MVHVRVVALSVTCAAAFRTASEAGLLDVEEVQARSLSRVKARRAAVLKRFAQPDSDPPSGPPAPCSLIVPMMLQDNPDICTAMLNFDDETLSGVCTGTHADVEAACEGGSTMTCAEGINHWVDAVSSMPADPDHPPPEGMDTVALMRAGMCTPPEDEAQQNLPPGCADFAAVTAACNGCGMMNMDACSHPFSDASGGDPGSGGGGPSGPPSCSTYLEGEGVCDAAVVMRPAMISMMGGPACTRAEIEEACGAGPASCGAALNAQIIVQKEMMAQWGVENNQTDADLRGEVCSNAPPTDQLPPQCADYAAVQASCGGCRNTTLDACSETFAEPTTTTATTTTSNAKLMSLCPLVAVLALLRLW